MQFRRSQNDERKQNRPEVLSWVMVRTMEQQMVPWKYRPSTVPVGKETLGRLMFWVELLTWMLLLKTLSATPIAKSDELSTSFETGIKVIDLLPLP